MKIVFAGTPAIAATCLQALIDSKHEIVAVYTQPDRPKGRGKKRLPSPVKELALENNIPVEQAETLKTDEAFKTLSAYEADIMVVVAYGLILPKAILEVPKYGCINVHASLLPKYRGAAPAQHAILNGDKETGVTIMQMDTGLDTGAILKQHSCDISNTDTSETLLNKLAHLGSADLLTTLNEIDTLKPSPQDERQASYAPKINKADAQIDWSQPADAIARAIRAYQPWPVAYSDLSDMRIRIFEAQVTQTDQPKTPGKIVKVDNDAIEVACGKDNLRLQTLQLPGKRAMAVHEILNGHADLFAPGLCFTSIGNL